LYPLCASNEEKKSIDQLFDEENLSRIALLDQRRQNEFPPPVAPAGGDMHIAASPEQAPTSASLLTPLLLRLL
jgi:hypothetical protein